MKEMKEKSGGQKKIFKKLLSVLLVFVLMITANGSWNLLRARAENGPEFPWMTFSFDDRGNPDNSYVTLEGAGLSGTQKMDPWEPVEVVPGGTYVVSLTPPEERQGFEPIVEVRIHIEGADDEVFSNVQFWDGQGEADPNLELNDGKFEITIPSEKFNGANVDIWWCDYDRVGPNDMEYCVEVVRNGEGEAFLDDFDEYFSVWEYEEYDNQGQPIRNWGGQKMIIPRECFEEGGAGEEGLSLKFASFEGFSFGRLQVNEEGGEPFVLDAIELEEGQEPVYLLTKDSFDGNGYLNMEVYFDGGMPSFNVFYDDYVGAVNISGVEYETPVKLNQGPVDSFTFGETYTFELVPPENRTEDCEYIVEIRVYNPEAPATVYSNRDFWDEANDKQAEANLEIEDDCFTFTVPQEEDFCGVDISIWWSDYDRICGNDEEYCIQVMNDRNGDSYFAGKDYFMAWEYNGIDSGSGETYGYGNQKFMIPKSDVESSAAELKFSPYEGYVFAELKVDNTPEGTIYSAEDLGDNPVFVLSKNLFDGGGNLTVEARYSSNTQPGPGGEPGNEKECAKQFAKFVSDGIYMFGDWDGDEEVDKDDLLLGMAQQIYYPEFNEPNRNLKKAYSEIQSYEDLKAKITIGERDSAADIVAWSGLSEGQGTKYTIPAYKYKFEFTDSGNADRNVLVEGVAWLFDFDDGSEYATNTPMDVVLRLTDSEGKVTYFLRNCDTDSIDPCNGAQSGEGAYCAVGDYEVKYNEEEKKYTRSVAILGNGAALDGFIFTEEEETEFVTFQGRNEMLVADAKGRDREIMDKYHIFGKFSFYKTTFLGMKIQGAGANGNTPAWSFATDPIWGSDAESNTDKEAIIYFGNDKVVFKPVTINGSVTSITNITKADTSIPDGAVSVYQDASNNWIAEFKSNYYDLVKFEVTYATDGDPVKNYINIHRVGIDIETVSGRAGDDVQLMHGTENGPVYKPTKDAETIVYATYYYPELNGTSQLVDLYATYTWKDGTVTKAVVSNKSTLNLSFHHDDTDDLQSSDFVLYEGSSDGAPVKVEVSAVVNGFDGASFSGMRFGSGKGVCWNNFATKR